MSGPPLRSSSADRQHAWAREQQRAWARERLNAREIDDARDLQADILRRITDAEFIPADDEHQAFLILRHGDHAPMQPAFFEARRREVLNRIESLSEQFFSIAPSRRRAMWLELSQRADHFPLATAKLQRLATALDIDLDRLRLKGEEQKLAEHLCALFTMPPLALARQRAALTEQFAQDKPLWERTAQRLLKKHPAIAALDETFVQRLAHWTHDEQVFRKPPRAEGPLKVKTKNHNPYNPDLSERPWIGVLVVVAIIVFSAMHSLKSSSSRSNSRPYVTPIFRSPSPQQIRIDPLFVDDEAFRKGAKMFSEIQSRQTPPTESGQSANKRPTQTQAEQVQELIRRLKAAHSPSTEPNSIPTNSAPLSSQRAPPVPSTRQNTPAPQPRTGLPKPGGPPNTGQPRTGQPRPVQPNPVQPSPAQPRGFGPAAPSAPGRSSGVRIP